MPDVFALPPRSFDSGSAKFCDQTNIPLAFAQDHGTFFVSRESLNQPGPPTFQWEINVHRAYSSAYPVAMPDATSLLPINVFPLVVGDLVQRKISSGGTASDFFFVQIGAHDGVHYDPIRPFVEKYHWRGLLVEPQPEIYQRLVANYASEPQLMFAKAAVAQQNGKATLYTFKKSPDLPDHASMLASFHLNALLHNGHGYKGEIEPIIVPALDLNTLLSKHKITQIDLLQIDTEGYDYEIIKLLEGCPIRPEIIHFESAFLDAATKQECGEFLHHLGYRAVTIGVDTIAYRQSSDDDFAETFANRGYVLG